MQGKRKQMTQETKDKIRLALTGKKLSDETKAKISKVTSKRIKNGELGFKKGYKPTEEHLRRLSEAHKGNVPNNKGKKMSEEFREKCRQRQLGKFIRSEEGKRSFKEKTSGTNNYRWVKNRSQLQKFSDAVKDRRSSIYNDWRKRVWERDGYKCRIGNKDCDGRLEAHHILGFTCFPELRYDINNGITLCHAHHPRRRAEEKRLIPTFQELVSVSKKTL